MGRLGLAAAGLAAQIASGVGVLTMMQGLGSADYYMGLAYTTLYYMHGVFVDEATGWDIYGYNL